MKIKQILDEAKKGVKAPKNTIKPRNFVAKNAVQSGAGAHKDKKKAAKQGDVKHKKTAMEVNEGFNPEYDDEAGMADNNLETLERAVQGIDDLISAGDNLPEWCQEKIAVAKSMLVTVWDYMRSEEDRLSEQYVGSGTSTDMQMAVDIAKMNARRAALAKIHGPNFTDVQMPDHEFGKVDLQPDGKGGYRASVPLNIKQTTQPNYLDNKPAPGNSAREPSNYMDNMPAKSDGKQTGRMAPMESTRNPDLMSPSDYDRYQQSQMDADKRAFKRQEMEHELGHEERGYYQVMIAKNGKWEYAKVQPRREGMNAAMDIIRRLHDKYPSMHLGMMWPNGQVENYGKGR